MKMPSKFNPIWLYGGIFLLLFFVSIINSKVKKEHSVDEVADVESNFEADLMGDLPAPPPIERRTESSFSAPSGVDRVDRTLLPQEKDAWSGDPESYGFNSEDRAFLEQHGVSEAEARAMETVLRENGIN